MMKKQIYFALMAVLLFILLAATAVGNFKSKKLTDLERLGKILYRDKDLSKHRNQSCQSCHHPLTGFEDPLNVLDPNNNVVSLGSDPCLHGNRNAPTSSYAGFNPPLQFDYEESMYFGGLFWDGRATGLTNLGDPLAEQAQGPFLNPVEMALDSKSTVVNRVKESRYAYLFRKVFGDNAFNNIESAYDNIAIAIAAFERSTMLQKFHSKFDQFWKECKTMQIDIEKIGIEYSFYDIPQGTLNPFELQGLILFNTKAQCSACHTLNDYIEGEVPPLFTDFTYDNLGIPKSKNELIENEPVDSGLGGFLEKDFYSESSLFNDAQYEQQYGKFKVSTLRNIANRAPYGHNGYFASLIDIINFYNERDVEGSRWSDMEPEMALNVNRDELGNLGLSSAEEWAIFAFLLTLSDIPEHNQFFY